MTNVVVFEGEALLIEPSIPFPESSRQLFLLPLIALVSLAFVLLSPSRVHITITLAVSAQVSVCRAPAEPPSAAPLGLSWHPSSS